MTLPTYSKRVRSMLFAIVLVAAPCAAHKIEHNHATTENNSSISIGLSELSRRASSQYLQSGNDRILDDFERLLNKQKDNSTQHLLARAWIAQARHQFTDSLTLINSVIEHDPTNGQAWLTKASVLQVQGEHALANRACGNVLRFISLETGLLCKARAAQSHDEKHHALLTVQTLFKQRLSGISQPETRGWAYGIAAELAAELHRAVQAETYFKASLEAFSSIQVRASYMDFLIQQQRYQDAVKISEHSTNPALYIRELIARKKANIGNPAHLRRAIQHTHRQFSHWQEHQDYQHAREMAMFYLDVMEKPTLALTLAEINLQNQKEQEDRALLRRAQQTNNNGKHRDS